MSRVVVVADFFAEEYGGGAERTTDALISRGMETKEIVRLKSADVTEEHVESLRDCYWVICNFANLSALSKLAICKNLNYSIVEYDYKFCVHRSPELHRRQEGSECDCSLREDGKINLAFYGRARKIFFMSVAQRDIFLSHVKTIKQENAIVLSSVFSDGDLRFIDSIKDNEKEDKYLIVKSSSWVKNLQGCVEYAEKNNLRYEIVQNLPYQELLIKLSTTKGLIFLPAGEDTCPRLVIEAFMLGCETILNNNVQHKDEQWFSDRQICSKYMSERAGEFWRHHE